MTVPAPLFAAVLVAGLLASLWSLAASIRAAGFSRYRRELWRLHDELVDAIVADKFTNEAAARDLLMQVRVGIAYFREHTAFRVVFTYALIKAFGHGKALPDFDDAPLLRHSDDPEFETFRLRYGDLISRSAFRTTVCSRLGLVWVPLVFLAVRLVTFKVSPKPLVEDAAKLARRPAIAEQEVNDRLVEQEPERIKSLALAGCY